MNQKNQLVISPYVIFYVKSVSDFLSFYKNAFQLLPSFVHEEGHFAELISGNVTLAVRSEEMARQSLTQEFQKNGLDSPLQAFEISFHTLNVDQLYQKALACGCTSLAGPHLKPWGQKAANIRDPFGIIVEITELPT